MTDRFGVEIVLRPLPLRELPEPAPAGSSRAWPSSWVISACKARSSTALVIWLSNPSTPSIGVPAVFASANNASIIDG